MSKEEADHFYLDKLIPDALAYLNAKTPKPSKLGEDGIYAFDANALITLYKVGNQATDVEVLFRKLASQKRLYVPERALQECLKNRTGALSYAMQEFHKQVSVNHSPSVPVVPMLAEHSEYDHAKEHSASIEKGRKDFRKAIEAMKSKLCDWGWDDPVTKLFCEVFTPERIVKCTTERTAIVSDLKWRLQMKLPPGYADASKPDGGIGDVLIWHTLIELGKSKQASVVFVSNDEKSDWVVNVNDVAVTARGELIAEFFAKTGQHFAVMNLTRFLELNQANDQTIEAVKEVEQVDKAVEDKGLAYLDDLTLRIVTSIVKRIFETLISHATSPDQAIAVLRKENATSVIASYERLVEPASSTQQDPKQRGAEIRKHLQVCDIRDRMERLLSDATHFDQAISYSKLMTSVSKFYTEHFR